MKLALVLGLVLVGLLKIPQLNRPEGGRVVVEGRAKGTKDNFKATSVSPTPSLPTTKPSPLPSKKPLDKNTPTPSPESIKEIILLNEERELKDEEIEISLPKLSTGEDWYLYLEIELKSTEDALGFDSPGFNIYLDEVLAYQLSVFEKKVEKIKFSLAAFHGSPKLLTIWSGNGGDGFKDTYTIIKKIKLVSQKNLDFVETEAIDDLIVTNDGDEYLTLEWSSPRTNDINLNKALSYEVRYLAQEITQKNWYQSQNTEVVFTQFFSPQSPDYLELLLIKAPPISSGFIAVRSVDSMGTPSALGRNGSFNFIDL